jgi:hypothetical protein
MCAPRPTATGPGHSHARCGAWPARARCDDSGDRAEWRLRRSRDPRAHSPAAAAVARICRAAGESHPPTPGLLASRSGSRPSGARRAVRPARRKFDDACSRAWPDRWDSDRSGHAVHRADTTTVHDRPRPIDLVVPARANPVAQSGSDPTRPARCQSRKRRQHVIPDPHSSSCGSICQGIPLRRTKTMPVRHARSETRGRPPFGRGGELGKTGSTRFHNASGRSAAAILVHVTAPKKDSRLHLAIAEAGRFCYTLLV